LHRISEGLDLDLHFAQSGAAVTQQLDIIAAYSYIDAQILQGPVDARSDGVEFAAEKSGNFLILQLLKAAEKEDFSFFLRQLPERVLQQFDFLLLLRGIHGKNRGQHFRLKRGLRRKLAKVIDARVARNLVDPSAERGARSVALAVFQDTEEYLLDKVFAQSPVARQLRIEIEERRLVAIKQHAQRFARAIAHLEHQILIGGQSHRRIMVLNGCSSPYKE